MNKVIQRYTWCDALIEAERLGLIEPGAVNLGLRLASAITWEPGKDRKGQPSGLYWKNEDALKNVCSSRATYFRYRKSLFETGFLIEVKGNLIPTVPDLSQIETVEDTQESQIETTNTPDESQIETSQSHIETTQSQIETPESQIEHPYSVDTYSGELDSVDTYTDTSASAPVPNPSLTSEHLLPSLNHRTPVAVLTDGVEEARQSQSETVPAFGVRKKTFDATLDDIWAEVER